MVGRCRLRRNPFDGCPVIAERFPAGAVLVLLSFSLPPAASAGPAAGAAGAAAPQCGSQAVLERLWTPEQLRGTRADGKTARLRPADHAPPEPLPPDVTLLQPDPASPLVVPAGSIRRVVPRDGARLIALALDLCERADQISAYERRSLIS
jgi:hypothetical protein